MAKKGNIISVLKDADTVLRLVTSKGLSYYFERGFKLFGEGRLEQMLAAAEESDDPEYLADCELFGLSPGCSERVARFAHTAFKVDNHPDRFTDPVKKAEQEEKFKRGEAAWGRICIKREWKP